MTIAPLPSRGRDGRWSGDLPAGIARDIARRLQAGERYDDISAAVGIRRSTGRRKCAEVARAIGLEVEQHPRAILTHQVCALVEAGHTDAAIAEKLGRSTDEVTRARVRGLGRKYGVTRLTAEERARIDRMLLDGFNQYETAAAIGCNQGTVSNRSKRLDLAARRDVRPPCECGKPAGHGGRCNLVIDPAHIRERLLAGATAADIAREFGRTAQSFKPKYVQPIIDQLTAEGHRCGCGQPFGHQFVCSVTMAVQRRKFTAEQRQIATDMVRRGSAVRAVREALSITVNSANMLVGEVRAALASEGVSCPCGQPIDHSLSCSARNGEATGRTAFRFSSATAAKMTPERRRIISKLARAGYGCKPICDRTGESEWRVDALISELRQAGLTPTKCATCDNPFNHKGPCVLSKRCACGRWRNHRGPCRSKAPKRTVSSGQKQPTVAPELRHEAMRRYRDGESIQRTSDATGISWSQVQRLFAYWRKRSHYDLKPCICGKPARHPGGCIKNTPAALGKLEKSRITTAIRQGDMPHTVAARLGVHIQTVLKHSAATRAEMFSEGVTCACGRPIGHPYWCSARWDAFEQPRGRRPFPGKKEQLAIDALVRGDVVADIARLIGVGTDSIWKLRRALPDEQRNQRTLAIRARLARASRRDGEAIMAQVKAAIPRHIEGAVRDDIEAELHLAVMDGRLEVEQIADAACSFIRKGMRQWMNVYGPRSLDQAMGHDDARTLADVVGDETTAAGIDDIEIGGVR